MLKYCQRALANAKFQHNLALKGQGWKPFSPFGPRYVHNVILLDRLRLTKVPRIMPKMPECQNIAKGLLQILSLVIICYYNAKVGKFFNNHVDFRPWIRSQCNSIR